MRPVLLLTAPAPMGGLETVVAQLASSLAAANVPVTLAQFLVPSGESPAGFLAVQHPNVTHEVRRIAARDYRGARAAVRALVAQRPGTLVHAHGARADLLARLAGVRPHVSTVHGFVTNSPKQRVAKWVHLRLLRSADRVIAVSAPLEQELARAIGARRVTCIPNAPPPPPSMDRATAREALGLSPTSDAPCIGWVGRVSAEKGPDLLLEALLVLRERHGLTPPAVVVGDGPERHRLETAAAASGLTSLRFVGARANAARLLSAFDLLALTSRTEGTPMTVLEAIDHGLPVVATPVGGVPSLLENGAGWLSAGINAEAIAEVLARALGDAAERARRAQCARERVAPDRRRAEWLAAHLSLYRALT